MPTDDEGCWNNPIPGRKHAETPSAWEGTYVDPTHETKTTFSYLPLDLTADTMRVLTILPGASPKEIECTLEHRVLTPRTYSCLSYAWGEADTMRTILVNGATFAVRKNLWNFLWQARENKYRDALWIDAICIDQNNILERNHQVQRMSRIYKVANEVIVWLGAVPEPIRNEMCYKLWALARQDFGPYFNMSSQCINWIQKSTYWSRAWILPEVYLAATLQIMIGCKKITFDRVREAYLREFPRQPARDRAYLVFYAWSTRIAKRHIGLRLIRDSACLHPRDRMYSMIGIIPALGGLRVRYDIDDPTVLLDVYEQSKPEHIAALNSLMKELGSSIEARGVLCCPKRMKNLTPALENALIEDDVDVGGEISTSVNNYKMLLGTQRISDHVGVSEGACTEKCGICYWSQHRSRGERLWIDRNRFQRERYLIDWSRSRRIDDHHLLLSIQYDESEAKKRSDTRSYWPKSYKDVPWWERDDPNSSLSSFQVLN